MLVINGHIHIAEDELVEHFTRASGPGGQHVNRTESAVELRFDAAASASLPAAVRTRLLAQRDRRISAAGVVVIRARRFRDQARNREDARARLVALIQAATHVPRKRIATRPTRASKERRLNAKKQQGQRKRARGRDWRGE